jgi:hypothetical protein
MTELGQNGVRTLARLRRFFPFLSLCVISGAGSAPSLLFLQAKLANDDR